MQILGRPDRTHISPLHTQIRGNDLIDFNSARLPLIYTPTSPGLPSSPVVSLRLHPLPPSPLLPSVSLTSHAGPIARQALPLYKLSITEKVVQAVQSMLLPQEGSLSIHTSLPATGDGSSPVMAAVRLLAEIRTR